MAEERRKLFKRLRTVKKPGWMTIVICILALVLAIEIVTAGTVRLISKRRAAAVAPVVVEQDNGILNGVTLYASGANFVVDNNFLVKLSELHNDGVQVVRVPIDLSAHLSGTGAEMSIDGEWLGQTASIMEMIFQSNYKVILSVRLPEDGSISAEAYQAIWTQIDAGFGHRPEDEMWYDLTLPANDAVTTWGTAIQQIITTARTTNANREILLSLPVDMDSSMRNALILLLGGSNVHLGFPVAAEMTTEELALVKTQADSTGNTAILIEPEGGMETPELATAIKDYASNYGFGYLLQGD